ncbi:MAG: alanine--tRNA ligase, partial [Terrimicrobiaceae bacterium]|nr:alanine--tRNA ligase [Terrimicrobiaceae bacterium]
MTSSEIRQSFLEFFREKRHAIVPSASLLPSSPNLLFTNAGMNQFVPIFLGEKSCPYSPPRAADTQKCIRAGGKHNDLEDVGLDTYHHTFFEMLGNWSFGDYFKAEAIRWAWELVVGRWGFPPHRLYATVYDPGPGEPGAADNEARQHWQELFAGAGLDAAIHVISGGKKDNFWMMGDTGPCGPCSELHVDLTPAGDSRGRLVNAGSPACMEIWNLVFIQFNAAADGSLEPLPARHVDTGMGLERVAAIAQCTRGFTDFTGRVSNYETDLFRPLFDEIESLSGLRYGSSLPGSGAPTEASDIAFRVIADHARALTFAVADGIRPGNTDRNYVLRRILRRAVRYGRPLGFREPFFYKLADVVARTMGEAFPELRQRLREVREVLHMEEEAFNRTLDKGLALFEAEAGRLAGKVMDGAFAFKLYDEQGFPLDLTQLLARERGIEVDAEGFERLMEAQRARARASQKKEAIEVAGLAAGPPTEFVGFDALETAARVLEIASVKGRTAIILDRTPCYAEMGGQVGDRGLLSRGAETWEIADTRKAGDVWLHILEAGDSPVS